MNRRTLLRQSAAALSLAAGATSLGKAVLLAQPATPAAQLTTLGFPELAVSVDDKGFTLPSGVVAGRTLMTVDNKGENELHFFAARIPDDVSDADLATGMATPDVDPPWFDMTKLTLLGTPDWPQPGAKAHGVVDLTEGRWLFLDPIDGRDVAILQVGSGSDAKTATEPAADVEIGLVEMISRTRRTTAIRPDRLEDRQPWRARPRTGGAAGRRRHDQRQADRADRRPDAGQRRSVFVCAGRRSRGHLPRRDGLAAVRPPGRPLCRGCMAPSPDPSSFEPHAMMGMVRLFTVQ